MTKNEALKLALETLECWQRNEDCNEPMSKILEAIKEVLAQPEQEPVAWLHRFIEGGISIGLKPADLKRHPERWEPLYTEPKPCPTCEALSRTVMLDQTSHDTTPPQRIWVGLTNQERSECWETVPEIAMKKVEAKLKEKNT